jgi:hypothetical protein
MSIVGQPERATLDRIIAQFCVQRSAKELKGFPIAGYELSAPRSG